MISIISGTNRVESNSSKIAKHYHKVALEMNADAKYFSMEALNGATINAEMYNPEKQDPLVKKLQEEAFFPADKLIVIVPEYNGGVSGIFKWFVDAISIREKDRNFRGKKVCLVGVASGRAGNLRGLDYLSSCLQYLGMTVFSNKLPLSQIGHVIKEDGSIDDFTQQVIRKQIEGFINF